MFSFCSGWILWAWVYIYCTVESWLTGMVFRWLDAWPTAIQAVFPQKLSLRSAESTWSLCRNTEFIVLPDILQSFHILLIYMLLTQQSKLWLPACTVPWKPCAWVCPTLVKASTAKAKHNWNCVMYSINLITLRYCCWLISTILTKWLSLR